MGCPSIIGGSGLKIMGRLCYQLYLGQDCKHDRPKLNYYELYNYNMIWGSSVAFQKKKNKQQSLFSMDII